MKQINLIIAIALMGLSQTALASMKVTVNGMVCSFCAQGIEKSISKMDETKAVFVDLKNKVVVVLHDSPIEVTFVCHDQSPLMFPRELQLVI